METLQVELDSLRYPIHIGSALLRDADLVGSCVGNSDLFVVTNETVAALYLVPLRATLEGRRVAECVLPDGERFKTLATAAQVFDGLAAARFHRDATVLALGGGVVGDIAGFAAACYQRGVDCVQFPTTLLAQVDSSVGGKTGVNHAAGKNLIGAFHQPTAVIADTDTLKTLPERELRAGVAEIIKCGCVWDASLFDWLEENVEALIGRDDDALLTAIKRSCAIKAEVVASDEREHGLRALLNFGHTFGHAIETATRYETYLHGEAVALGMVMAADLSQRLGLIEPALTRRLNELLARAQLPVEPPRIGAAHGLQLMRMDKKVRSGALRLVLLERLGRAAVSAAYPQDALEATLARYFD